jgi:glycosyltransferase involved in cell wall biosynthesis
MENGLVYDAADPSQLVAHVIRLRDDVVLRQRLAAQAYAYAQTRDWHQSMDDLVNCYEALVESKTDATP